MAQAFYLKAQSLHEEFQKRELHYLNIERKLHSTVMQKKDLNLTLQDYLQRIKQKEKETEETYRNIMKQMEEINRHTDEISLKLEKLGILRNSVPSLAFPNQPFNLGSNLQIYGISQSLNAESTIPQFELNSLRPSPESKSVSTQTENNMYCNKCSSLLHIPSHMKNLHSPYMNILSGRNDKPQVTHSSKSQNDSGNHNDSQFVTSSADIDHFTVQVHENKSTIDENSEIEKQAEEKSPGQNLYSEVVLDERRNSFENKLESNKGLITENAQNTVSENKEMLTESQFPANRNYESKSADSEANVEASVSKSDAESMNNEFDFLESDTANTSSNLKTQNSSKRYISPPNDVNVGLDKAASSVERHPSGPALKHKKERGTFPLNPKLEVGDDKSETSGSMSGPHSPNISVASDSDSVYEKGSSLTASAAYQALLGNAVIPVKTKINELESESEDEVENVLASAVQRTHIKPKSSVQSKNDKSASQPVDSKPAVKGSKPPLMNNPQSKLSKNTRKVLGLDTSSGSEVEVAVKAPGKKIDEDSDEFDFYD